jgi:hypothetical protein
MEIKNFDKNSNFMPLDMRFNGQEYPFNGAEMQKLNR